MTSYLVSMLIAATAATSSLAWANASWKDATGKGGELAIGADGRWDQTCPHDTKPTNAGTLILMQGNGDALAVQFGAKSGVVRGSCPAPHGIDKVSADRKTMTGDRYRFVFDGSFR